MEYPSKRQKLSRIVTQFTQTFTESKSNEELSGSPISTTYPDDKDVRHTMFEAAVEDSELRRRNVDFVVPRNVHGRRSTPQRPRLQRRDSERRDSERHKARSPQATVTKSVIDVIIDEGTRAVAVLTITDPAKANTISISDLGVLTVPPITTLPTTITTSIASPTASGSSAGGSASDLQSVLSSPPATPISSPSVSGSGGLLPAASALLSGKNITTSVFTSTGSHTTITGTSIIDLSTVTRNHTTARHSTTHTTLKTSTRHSSQSSSGASLTGASSAASGSGSPTGTASGTATGGGGAGTATTSATGSAASTSAAGSGGSGNNSGPATPTVVGGVVGAVAGLTVILLLLLLLLRWWKRKARQRTVDEPTGVAAPLPSTTQPPSQPMPQDPRPTSHTPLMSALSPAFLSRWRMSAGGQTVSSSTTVPLPSERGFQKVSGRKIDSVLTSGGDGYGDAASSKETAPSTFSGPSALSAPSVPPVPPELSDTSFYRDSQGFYGGVGLQPSPRPSGQLQRDSGAPGTIKSDDGSDIVVMRPSPARTPLTSSPGVSVAAFPNPPQPRAPGTTTPRTATPPLTALPHPRDALGRSHPSFDGSRGSRFTESV